MDVEDVCEEAFLFVSITFDTTNTESVIVRYKSHFVAQKYRDTNSAAIAMKK